MRKLNRQLLRWRRYADKTGWYRCWTCTAAYKPPPGWDRALAAQHREWAQRNPLWIEDLMVDPWWEDA